jgi:hypothetical protein
VGFVETFVPPVQPVLAQGDPSVAVVRCWAKYFSNVDRSLPTVTISTQWVDFFTLLLLKPGSFEWAQSFLQSPAWVVLNQLFNGNTFSFSLPNSPPSVQISKFSCYDPPDHVCLDHLEEVAITEPSVYPVAPEEVTPSLELAESQSNLQVPDAITPPPVAPLVSAPRGKRGKTIHISDANVRRSPRVHNNTCGFKSSNCRDKNCLGCSSNPPLLSSSVVRELDSTFCQLDPAAL